MGTRKTKRGGKFLYSGAYGCSFKPAIKCKGAQTRKNSYISKIMNKTNALDEMARSEFVRKANTQFQYFVYPDELCVPEPEKSNGFDSCDLKFLNQVSLLSPDGGTDLYHLRPAIKELPAFFEGLLNVFDGLILLHKNNYIHCDVKPPNIVGQKLPDNSYKIRLIDFGLSTTVDECIRKPKVDNYAYWPFDFRLLDNTYVPNANDINEFYTAIKWGNFPTWFYYENGKKIISIKWVLSMFKKLLTQNPQTVVLQCDTFSLGRTIYELYNMATGHISTGHDSILGVAPNHVTLVKHFTLPLFNLVREMCLPDPFLRIDLVLAREKFAELLPILRKEISTL